MDRYNELIKNGWFALSQASDGAIRLITHPTCDSELVSDFLGSSAEEYALDAAGEDYFVTGGGHLENTDKYAVCVVT